MLELNRVLITGRLTRDPETRTINSGKLVAKMDLAINRKGYGGGQDEVCFVEVIAWEKTAEFARGYLHKGSGVFVEGRLKMDTWQDKETGANRSKLMIVADRLAFAESKPKDEGGQRERKSDPERRERSEPARSQAPDYEDDPNLLPF